MLKKLFFGVVSWVPPYSIIPLIVGFLFNTLIYKGVMPIAENWYHHDFTTDFDRLVPIIPEFVIIYLGCYIFWIINYILIAKQGKEHFYRFWVADFTSRIVCLIFYLALPTTNIRPELAGTGICEALLNWVWSIDPAVNLFPSIHCLVSWFCYIGIRGQEQVPKWYRAFSCIFAILVCLSTQFTKQHYVIDIVGGVALAELTYLLGRKTNLYKGVQNFFERMNQKYGLVKERVAE